MSENLIILPTEIKFDWTIQDLLTEFGPDHYHGHNILPSSSIRPHFQVFDVGISNTSNFHNSKKSSEILDKVIDLKSKITTNLDLPLVEHFIKTQISIYDIQILRIDSAKGALPHIDRRRKLALNIGLYNSELCKIHMCDSKNFNKDDFYVRDFYEGNLEISEHQINDGQVYLINTGSPHSVISIGKTGYRYLITISLDLNRHE